MKNPLNKIPYWYLLLLPTFFLYFGSFLNISVMAINHNLMPVLTPGVCTPDRVEDGTHTCMVAATHVKFLADWIFVGDGIASIGDMFIFAGEALLIPFLYVWAAFIIKDSFEEK